MSSTNAPTAVVRPATLADAKAIARVHIDSWRTTYAGILPSDFLANLSYAAREEMWRRNLTEESERNYILVAEQDRRIVGFVDCGRERSGRPDYAAEVYAIYLIEDHQRMGLGKELFLGAVEWLARLGYESVLVWVAERNPACGFYEAMGGVLVGEKEEQIGKTTIREVAYGWQGLGSFSV